MFPCFYNSLFLAPFVAGDIKYFRIGVGSHQEGETYFNIFLHNSLLITLVSEQTVDNFVEILLKLPAMSPI